MEKGAGDDSARGVGMCDRLLTFLAKNLSMNRQKNITEGPINGSSNISDNHAEEQKEEEEEDEFAIQIEKVEFEFSHEEDHKSVEATILEERNTDVSTARASDQQQEEEAADHQVDAEATAAMVQEKKVRSIKDDREEAGDKDAAAAGAKKSLFKKRRASSSDQLGAGGEDPKLPRRSLRPRMPAILRVPSNIDEQSTTFIDERKRSFGRRKPEK